MKIRTYRSLFLVVCHRTETRLPSTDILYLRPGTGRKVATFIELLLNVVNNAENWSGLFITWPAHGQRGHGQRLQRILACAFTNTR